MGPALCPTEPSSCIAVSGQPVLVTVVLEPLKVDMEWAVIDVSAESERDATSSAA